MKAFIHLALYPKGHDLFSQVIEVDLPQSVLLDEDDLREALIKPHYSGGTISDGSTYCHRICDPSILERLVMFPKCIEIMGDFDITKVEITK